MNAPKAGGGAAAAPKRVLAFVGGTYVFGAEIAALDMLAELARRGHSIHCVVSGWNDGDMIRRIETLGWPYTVVKLGFLYLRRLDWTFDTLLHYPGARAACKRILREFNPDVAYFLGTNGLLMLPGFAPASQTVVHIVDAGAPSPKTKSQFATLSRRAARFIAISNFTSESIASQGIPRDRVSVVYPPVMLEPDSSQEGRALRPGLHSAPESRAPRIGIVGQLIPRKGHVDLFEAAARLVDRGHEFSLHVYGRGPADITAALERQAHALGLTARTTFHGFVADRAEIYRNLDVVVVPTRDDEALGLVAAEPGVFGLPVIASRAGGLPEVVLDDRTGLLFKPGDVDDLAGKIERLLTKPGLATRLGAAARVHIADRFGRDSCGDAFERLITQSLR